MASITFALDPKLKSEMTKFRWVNWSELVREGLIEREKQLRLLLERLNSKEEQERIKWSVELGRKTKKDRFKKLLSGVSPEIRKKLLNNLLSSHDAQMNLPFLII